MQAFPRPTPSQVSFATGTVIATCRDVFHRQEVADIHYRNRQIMHLINKEMMVLALK